MHRRQLLFVTAAGLTKAALPAAARGRDGGERAETPACDVELALARAGGVGKPLLVLVVPSAGRDGVADALEAGERRQLLGQLLNLADAEVMAALALCEVVCASFASLARHVPVAREPEGLPLAVLVDPDGRSRFVAADGLPEHPFETGWPREEDYERRVRERVRVFGERVIAAVGLDPATLRRRAADCRAALGPHDVARLDSDHPVRLEPDLADRGAALLLLAADRAPDRELRVAHVAGIAARRLRMRPPAGARWAVSIGCGGFEEEGCDGERDWGYSCGIGCTPEISRRFLRFYTGACGAAGG